MRLLQRQIEHQGTKIKHLRINCDKKDLRCLPMTRTYGCERSSIVALHLQAYRLRKKTVAVKFGRRSDLTFSVKEITTNLSTRDVCFEFHKRNYILPSECNTEHRLDHCVVDINTGNSDWSKERDGFHFTNRQLFKNETRTRPPTCKITP